MLDKQTEPVVLIQLDSGTNARIPLRATNGSAGYDVCASRQVLLPAGAYTTVPTGLRLGLPDGFEAQVRPRSGLAAKHGISVLNAPGTIDSDYRGEVGVILINHGKSDFLIEPGMRIAQLVFAAVVGVNFVETKELSASERGEGGFGSTGTR